MVDRLLPAQLWLATAVGEAELAIRRSLLGELVAWLAEVARAVLASIRPDPIAVWSTEPRWRVAVARVVDGPVTDALVDAYRVVTGTVARPDDPWVSGFLTLATERMADMPDRVQRLVAAELARGVEAGESVADLAARVETLLSTTATDRWTGRADLVAANLAGDAVNAARAVGFRALAAELGGRYERVWVATLVNSRPTHVEAHGQRVGLDEPFEVGGYAMDHPRDRSAPVGETENCRCGMIMTIIDGTVDVSEGT